MIVEHLDRSTAKIEAAIAVACRQIELTEEFRTRLFADVVTGKLDVRDAVSRLPDEEDDNDWPEDALSADSADDGDHVSEEPADDSAIESEVTA